MKPEGRTQLVGYAYQQGLVKTMNEGRKMPLETLRSVVTLHREAIARKNKQWKIDDASIARQLDTTATTAEKE
jgi:hypothetical protein